MSDFIFDETGVRLSPTTLKRVWGRIKYKNSPTTTTLNALAQFAGEEDWRSFMRHCLSKTGEALSTIPVGDEAPIASSHSGKVNKLQQILILAGILLLVLVSVHYIMGRIKAQIVGPVESGFAFKADKICAVGVPNSVIFTYNATAAETDSVFIIQTWDYRRKTRVSRFKDHHSAIYYYPGFFRTALVADGTIVKQHDLQISTDGWLGLVEIPDKPFYFRKRDIIKGETIEIDDSLLMANNFQLMPIAPKVRLFNQTDLGGIRNDRFEFHTELRNRFNAGNNFCQNVEVLIQCKDDIIIIPLMASPCVGDASLYIPGREFESSSTDLSGFGANLSEWTELHVVCRDQNIQFYVNGKEAFNSVILHDPTDIVGVQIRFNGPGAVRNTWFKGTEGAFPL